MKMMKTMAAAASAAMIAAMSVASITASAAIEFDADNKIVAVDKGPYSAYLCLQAGADTQCKPGDLGGAECEFSTDGSYSVSATMKNGSDKVELMALETNLNAYSYAPVKASCKEGSLPDGCTVSIKIDSIKVANPTSGSGYTIDYKGPSDGALCLSKNDSTVRVNILNQLTNPKVADIEEDLSAKGGLAAGDVVTVNFTVSGIAGGGNGGGEDGTTATTGGETPGNTTTTTAVTTTDEGGNSGGASGGSSNGGSSSGNSSSGKSSGNSSTGNAKTSQTGDFGIAAVALGAVATAALAAGAVTVTRRKK